jgi:hypothetical protein
MPTSKKEIALSYFIRDPEGGPNGYICQCGTRRTQDIKKGYQNLASHVFAQHSDYEEVMKKKVEGNAIHQFVNSKAQKVFTWLEWILMRNQPFSEVEDPLTRALAKSNPICRSTLMTYIKLVTVETENKIKEELPDRFGIVLDGWSEGSTHYIAVFAAFEKDGVSKMPLLAIAPPLDEENYDAESHKAFITYVLETFGKRLNDLIYMVADNASVNRRLSELLGIPLIGCASHRFNLAVKKFLLEYEDILLKIHNLMKALGNIKQAGKLRKSTNLRPVKRNVTRWSSTFAMLERFYAIKEFIDQEDPELAIHFPTGMENVRLQRLFKDMQEFEIITKQLQKVSCSLSDVRAIFDETISTYPAMAFHLASDAQIVQSPNFEKGIVKVLDDKTDQLTFDEHAAVSCFQDAGLIVEDQERETSPNASDQTISLVQKALQRKRRRLGDNVKYKNLALVPATSNAVERLFSNCRLVLTD